MLEVFGDDIVVAACKLPLAPVRVLSIASCANAKSLHARWPIRAPTFRLRQSERHGYGMNGTNGYGIFIGRGRYRLNFVQISLRDADFDPRAAPIRTRELSSRLSDLRRILTNFGASRKLQATSRPRLYISNTSFIPHYCAFGQRAILSLGSTTSHFNIIRRIHRVRRRDAATHVGDRTG